MSTGEPRAKGGLEFSWILFKNEGTQGTWRGGGQGEGNESYQQTDVFTLGEKTVRGSSAGRLLRAYISIPDGECYCQKGARPLCLLLHLPFPLSLPVLEEAEADNEEKGRGEALGSGQRSQPCLLPSPPQAL